MDQSLKAALTKVLGAGRAEFEKVDYKIELDTSKKEVQVIVNSKETKTTFTLTFTFPLTTQEIDRLKARGKLWAKGSAEAEFNSSWEDKPNV